MENISLLVRCRICIILMYIVHFIGKPVDDPLHVDYVPSLFVYTCKSMTEAIIRQRNERHERIDRRRKLATEKVIEKEVETQSQVMAAEALMMLSEVHIPRSREICACQDSQTPTITNTSTQTNQITTKVTSAQTIEVQSTDSSTQTSPQAGCSVREIEGNDDKTKFYTGLPSWAVFMHVYLLLEAHISRKKVYQRGLTLKDEFLLVLMRLRLNLLLEDLAYRFNIAKSTVSNIFDTWIDVMAVQLNFLIKWVPKDLIMENMPQIFRETYPTARCIIDCSEVFIEQPLSFQARAQTYSNYKKHNTIKFLIAITPAGTISFISHFWGGRVSDKFITQQSGFLKLLEHGDTVLVDRGFNISEDVGLCGAKLEIPSFTRGKIQLTKKEIELSHRLARVRIHVERVIGLMKNKYTMLQGPLPVSVLKHKGDSSSDLANIDKILIVCAALTNLSPSIVPP